MTDKHTWTEVSHDQVVDYWKQLYKQTEGMTQEERIEFLFGKWEYKGREDDRKEDF